VGVADSRAHGNRAAPSALKTPGIRVAPSLLAADFSRLAEQVVEIERAGATLLHLDIMDGHFVPNISFGLPVIESLRRRTKLFFDAHLMIDEPARYAGDFLRAGCDHITFHIEATLPGGLAASSFAPKHARRGGSATGKRPSSHSPRATPLKEPEVETAPVSAASPDRSGGKPHSPEEAHSDDRYDSDRLEIAPAGRSPGARPPLGRTLHKSGFARARAEAEALIREVQSLGGSAGICLNPATPVEAIEPLLKTVELVLVMSVWPGFGGQAFMPETLEKVRQLRSRLRPDQRLEIDGGISAGTVGLAVRAGADTLVAGSAVFGAPDPAQAYAGLVQLARDAAHQ